MLNIPAKAMYMIWYMEKSWVIISVYIYMSHRDGDEIDEIHI